MRFFVFNDLLELENGIFETYVIDYKVKPSTCSFPTKRINQWCAILCSRFPPQTGPVPAQYGPPGSTGPSINHQPQYAPSSGQRMI